MTENIKVFELAKELNLKALDLIDKIKPLDLRLKNHMAELTGEQVDKIKAFLNPPEPEAKKKPTVARRSKSKDDSSTLRRKSEVVLRRESSPREGGETPAVDENTEEVLSTQATAESVGEIPALETSVEVEASQTDSPSAETESLEAVAEEAPESSAPVEPAAVVADQAAPPPRRGPRYSVIRVVSAEPAARAKPLIVEDAVPGAFKPKKSSVPKTYSDPILSKTAAALLQKEIADEENRKKKASPATRGREEDNLFKSTDYLRRERVYQPKKKKISLGRSFAPVNTTIAAAHKRMVSFDGEISVEELARQLSAKALDVVRKLRNLGVEEPEDGDGWQDWSLDLETAQLVAHEFSFDVKDETFREAAFIDKQGQSSGVVENLSPRSPVVTIMGHVDHGKTSLLDLIRRARVVSGEAGGITQHIGAYTVTVADAIKNLASIQGVEKSGKASKKAATEKPSKKEKGKAAPANAIKVESLTFLDTPGHAAFTAMRSRGAKITDIVILVVAATEGMMPQTREAVEHAKAAGVPVIVAMNKMDLPEANPDRCRQQLSEVGLISEDWGGDTIFVPVSAKTGLGVDKLLEMIQLQAEIMQLKARADGQAEGIIVEAKLDKGRGALATALIKQGTLKVGDFIVAGTFTGKVRALIDDKGNQIKSAGPSTPVEILGIGGVPEAGDSLNAFGDEQASRELAEHRQSLKKSETTKAFTLEDIYTKMTAGEIKELPVIIKSDVKGSAEAIQAALLKLPTKQVKLKILSTAVGGISESDVLLASASQAIIFGFNVRPDSKSQSLADQKGVQIKAYTIIYNLLDDVTKAMTGLLEPTIKETVMGRAEVRNTFANSKVGMVAGCSIIKGKVQRSNSVRLIRDNRVVYTGKVSGLRRFKDDVREVAEGFECGISIENFNDIKVGDIIESFAVESVEAVLQQQANA